MTVDLGLASFFDAFPFSERPRPASSGPIGAFALAALFEAARAPLLRTSDALKHDPPLNVWDAVGLGRDERLHCRFLAWLVDARATHGQGPDFLLALLREIRGGVARSDRPDDPVPVLEGVGAYRVEVETSTANDRLIDITLQGTDFIVLIEAKIDARESSDQVADYVAWAHEQARRRGIPNERVWSLFLTPGGARSTTGPATPFRWQQVADACIYVAKSLDRATDGGRRLSDLLHDYAARCAVARAPSRRSRTNRKVSSR